MPRNPDKIDYSGGLPAIFALGLLLKLSLSPLHEAVLTTNAVTARKGPAYTYAPAFNQALHEGLELTVIEKRNDWLQIQLPDSRLCWISANKVQQLDWTISQKEKAFGGK